MSLIADIDNKAGAGGTLGAAEAARTQADGYTLLMASPPLIISPAAVHQAALQARADRAHRLAGPRAELDKSLPGIFITHIPYGGATVRRRGGKPDGGDGK